MGGANPLAAMMGGGNPLASMMMGGGGMNPLASMMGAPANIAPPPHASLEQMMGGLMGQPTQMGGSVMREEVPQMRTVFISASRPRRSHTPPIIIREGEDDDDEASDTNSGSNDDEASDHALDIVIDD